MTESQLAAQAMQSMRHALGEFLFANEADITSQQAAALMVRQAFELLIEVTSTDRDPIELVGESAVALYVRASAVQATLAGTPRRD